MKIVYILTLLFNQLAVIFEAYLDVQRQKQKRTIHHTASAWFRGIGWVGTAISVHWTMEYLTTPGSIGLSVLYCFVLALQYWLTFNLFHNGFNSQVWYYGNTGFFDSILPGRDNRYKNIGLKLGLFILFAFTYFNIYGLKK